MFSGSVTSPSAMFAYDPARREIVATPNGVIYRKLVSVLVGSTLLGTVATGPSLPPGIPAVDVRALRGTDGKLRMLVVSAVSPRPQHHLSLIPPHSVCPAVCGGGSCGDG